jgi:putative sterol carrier protein
MPLGLNAKAAAGVSAVLQFEISGAENFTAHLVIADGKAGFAEGPADRPSLTIRSPAEVWLGISQGRINGQQAFMAGQFRAEGDFNLLMRMDALFKG